jgi:hypothetical protein
MMQAPGDAAIASSGSGMSFPVDPRPINMGLLSHLGGGHNYDPNLEPPQHRCFRCHPHSGHAGRGRGHASLETAALCPRGFGAYPDGLAAEDCDQGDSSFKALPLRLNENHPDPRDGSAAPIDSDGAARA